MNTRTPRHRGEKSPATRRQQTQVVLMLLGLTVMVVAWMWLAVATDKVLLAIGLLCGSILGERLRDKRKARKRARRGSEPAG